MSPQTITYPDPQITQLSDIQQVLLPTHEGIPVTTTTQILYTLPSSASVLSSNEVMTRNRFIDPLTMQAASPYVPSIQHIQRWGKAPPVDPFTAENEEMRFDDWILTLERAAAWNNWSEEDATCWTLAQQSLIRMGFDKPR